VDGKLLIDSQDGTVAMDWVLCLSCYPLWARATGAVVFAALVGILLWKYRHRINAAASWSLVRKFSDSRLIKMAMTALIVIPWIYQYILRPIAAVNEWMSSVFGVEGELSLTTLGIVVVGALIVGVGYAIYALFCPDFIKEYKANEAGRFRDRESDLGHAFVILLQSQHTRLAPDNIANTVRQFSADVKQPLTPEQFREIVAQPSTAITIVENLDVPKADRAAAFRDVHAFANWSRPAARLVCLTCYGIGGLFLISPYLLRLTRFLVAWAQ
jgi:hypothetical protein